MRIKQQNLANFKLLFEAHYAYWENILSNGNFQNNDFWYIVDQIDKHRVFSQ